MIIIRVIRVLYISNFHAMILCYLGAVKLEDYLIKDQLFENSIGIAWIGKYFSHF